MKLIIGIGNPGEKYRSNRHNVGYMVVEHLERVGLPEGIVAKNTDTFMNDSGQAVSKLKNFYKVGLSDLYVVHDDLDIPLGQYKIQLGIGPKVHNGLNSVNEALGSREYWRVRIGVDNRDPGNRTQGDQYVLQDFALREKTIIEGVIKNASKDLIASVT